MQLGKTKQEWVRSLSLPRDNRNTPKRLMSVPGKIFACTNIDGCKWSPEPKMGLHALRMLVMPTGTCAHAHHKPEVNPL